MGRTFLLSRVATILALGSSTFARAENIEGRPQKLPTMSVSVCGRRLLVEVAETEEQREIGLMHREGIARGTGMLFAFNAPRPLVFWMHNVPFDIDIGFFDARGRMLNSMTMKGTSPLQNASALPRYPSSGDALFAVEAPAGWFAGTKIGCRLTPLPKLGK